MRVLPLLRLLGRVNHSLSFSLSVVAMVFVALIWLLMSAEIVVRYTMGKSLMVSWEFSGYLLGWAVFLAAPEAARRAVHVRVSAVTNVMPERLARITHGLAALLCVLVGGFATIAIIGFALDAFERGIVTQTTSRAPQWILYALPAAGLTSFTLVSIHALASIVGGSGDSRERVERP